MKDIIIAYEMAKLLYAGITPKGVVFKADPKDIDKMVVTIVSPLSRIIEQEEMLKLLGIAPKSWLITAEVDAQDFIRKLEKFDPVMSKGSVDIIARGCTFSFANILPFVIEGKIVLVPDFEEIEREWKDIEERFDLSWISKANQSKLWDLTTRSIYLDDPPRGYYYHSFYRDGSGWSHQPGEYVWIISDGEVWYAEKR